MSERQVIIPPGMEQVYEKIPYSPAVRVGDTIYVSGQIGRDKEMNIVAGTEAQIVQAFENLRLVLSVARATMEDIVDLTTFHTDMRDLSTFMQVKDRYLTRNFPAWTAIGVASLGGVSGLVIEIKAIAVLSAVQSAASQSNRQVI